MCEIHGELLPFMMLDIIQDFFKKKKTRQVPFERHKFTDDDLSSSVTDRLNLYSQSTELCVEQNQPIEILM